MLQKLSQLEPVQIYHSGGQVRSTVSVHREAQAGSNVSLRDTKTHSWREAYALPITADSLTEQRGVRKVLFDWQVQSGINYLQNQLNTLQDQSKVFKEEEVDVNIDWGQVRAVVETAASELDWDVEISIDTAENLIVVVVPEDQDDLMVETEFDFYTLIIKQLSKEVFKAINFFFI